MRPSFRRQRHFAAKRKRFRQLGLEVLEDRRLLARVDWISDSDGSWDDAANWRDEFGSSRVPESGDDVVIDRSNFNVRVAAGNASMRSLQNVENLVVSGTFSVSAVINNQIGGVLEIVGVRYFGDASLTINNDGVLREVIGAGGDGDIRAILNNRGTVEVQSGTLYVAGTGQNDGGEFRANSDTTLVVAGDYSFLPGTRLTGSGTHRWVGNGTITANTSINPEHLELSGARVTGTLTNFGDVTWIYGTLGPGTINIAAGGVMHIVGGVTFNIGFDGVTLNNSGRIELSTASINYANLSVINNQVGGVFEILVDRQFGGASLTINNDGVLRKMVGTGDGSIGAILNNRGTVEVQSGTLYVAGMGQNDGGEFRANSGTTLVVAGDYSFLPGTRLTGSGTHRWVGNGTITANTSINPEHLEINGARVTGTLTNSGDVSWLYGTLGPGTINIAASGVMHIVGAVSYNPEFNGVTLNNSGRIEVSTGSINYSNFPVINNQVGGELEILVDVQFGSASLTINNDGVLRKMVGTGDGSIGAILNNRGTVEVQSGTLYVAGTGQNDGGEFRANTGTTLVVAGDYSFLPGTRLTGSGTHRWVGNGTITANTSINPEHLEINGARITGTLTNSGDVMWISGTLGPGIFNNAVGAALHIGGGNGGSFDGVTLNNAGYIDLGSLGGSAFGISNSPVINNQLGGVFDILIDRFFGDPRLVFNNDGVLRKVAGTGDGYFDSPLNNRGTVEIQTGTLLVGRGGGQNDGGEMRVETGATLRIAGDYSMLAGTRLTGSGTHRWIASSTITVNTSVDAEHLVIDGANVTGTLTNFGDITWLTGRIGPGTFNLAASGVLKINGGNGMVFDAATVNNSGRINLNSGSGLGYDNAPVINNQVGGELEINGDFFFGQSSLTFNNEGLIRKTQGPGDAYFDAGVLNNTGVVEVATGTLYVRSNVAQLPADILEGGTWNVIGSSVLHMGPQPIRINRGNVTLNGESARFPRLDSLAVNEGMLHLAGGRDFSIVSGLTNAGEISLGPGSQLSVPANFEQGPDAKLHFEIGGPPNSGQVGQLVVAGAATLSGTLDVALANGFGPAVNQSFPLITYASHQGDFEPITGLHAGRVKLLEAFVEDQVTRVQALTDAADLTVRNITIPASGVPGQVIAVDFTVMNNQPTPTTVDRWFDSVYLSANRSFDSSDKLIGRVEHIGVLDGLQSYVGHLSAPLPGAIPGKYEILVITDSRGQTPDVNRANNSQPAATSLEVTVPLLVPGTPINGMISAGQALYYQIDSASTQSLRIAATVTVANQMEMVARFADVPTRSMYDIAANGADSQPRIVLTNTFRGSYYVLLHGREGAGAGQPFEIRVDPTSLEVRSISPVRGSFLGSVTATIQGLNFAPDATVTLVGGNQERAARAVQWRDGTTLYATFDLTGLPLGVYAVRVTSDGVTTLLPAAFTVNDAPAGRVQMNLVVPDAIRVGFDGTITADYTNVGETDVVAPLAVVTANNAVLKFAGQPEFAGKEIQFLALNPAGPAGILPPGARGQITFAFQPVVNTSEVTFSLSEITDTRPQEYRYRCHVPSSPGGEGEDECVDVREVEQLIEWLSLKEPLRPKHVSPDAWDAIWTNFSSDVGATPNPFNSEQLLGPSATLKRLLADNATHLSRFGEYIYDAGRLLSMVLEQAGNSLPQSMLEQTIDASSPATGLPLFFGRAFQQPLAGRYRIGTLGRGWFSPWEITATLDADGNVTIGSPDSLHTFQRQADGSYRAPAGDAAKLVVVTGNFELRESDGRVIVVDATGHLVSITDQLGDRIAAGFTDDLLTSLTHSNGDRFELRYGTAGRLVELTDQAGRVTTYTYDAANEHLVRVSGPFGVTSYTYETTRGASRRHELLSIEHPDGTHTRFAYDDRARLIRQSGDQDAETVNYSYFTGGMTVADGGGRATTFLFDDAGRLRETRNSNGEVTRVRFDDHGNSTELTSSAGLRTSSTRDPLTGRVQQINPAGDVVTFEFAPVTNQLSMLRDGKGNPTNFDFDAAGNLRQIEQADGSAEQFINDAQGNLIQTVNRRGRPTSFTRDGHGQVTRKEFADGSRLDYTYDNRGNLLTATDSNGVTSLEYDTADRLTKITYPTGRFLQYEYDTGGRRTRMADQNGFAVRYIFDAFGRLETVADDTGLPLTTYAYNTLGQLVGKTNRNGTSTENVYNQLGQLTRLVNRARNGDVNSQFDYLYDDAGQRASMTTLDGLWTYEYDVLGQLTHAAFDSTTAAIADQDLHYEYDAVGNRVRAIVNGVATDYSTNDLNQYTTSDASSFAYDLDGNLISSSTGPTAGVYRYDDENRLVSVQTSAGSWSYEYDVFGNRTATVHDGQRTEYLVDPFGLSNVVAEYDGTGQLAARYVHGNGLTSRIDATTTGFYDFDGLGSTVGLSGATGGYLDQYAYAPFGERLRAEESIPNPFEFVGQQGVMADGNGLDFVRARHYCSTLGRFVSTDPASAGGDVNQYAYSDNNPTNLIDPDGNKPCRPNGSFISGDVSVQDVFADGSWQFLGSTIFGHSVDIQCAGDGNLCLVDVHLVGQFDSIAVNDFPPLDSREIWSWTRDFMCEGRTCVTRAALRSFGNEKGIDLGGLGISGLSGFVGPGGCRQSPPLPPPKPPKPPPKPPLLCKDVNNSSGSGGSGEDSNDAPRTCIRRPGPNHKTRVVRSFDPNDIIGPGGFGADGFVVPDQSLDYMIRFENQASATAAAQVVTVTQRLDDDLDLNTFELGQLGFGSVVVDVPAGRRTFETRIDLMQSLGEFVDVEADINLNTRVATWTLTSVDPETGDLPDNPFGGFLPPNTVSPMGEGFVTYRVRPFATSATTTRIDAVARIVFDTNDPIDTPAIFNTIDAGGPNSRMEPLRAASPTKTFPIRWAGTDDTGGSGVGTYDVLVSEDNGPYLMWQERTSALVGSFDGLDGRTYRFVTLAHDNVLHAEPPRVAADTTIVVAASRWQNPVNRLDVNNDSFVVPQDVLRIVNDLNSIGPRELPVPDPADVDRAFVDVDDDGFEVPLDALLIINFLNGISSAEGEPPAAITDTPLLDQFASNSTRREFLIGFDDQFQRSLFTNESRVDSAVRFMPSQCSISQDRCNSLPVPIDGSNQFSKRSLFAWLDQPSRSRAVSAAKWETELDSLFREFFDDAV